MELLKWGNLAAAFGLELCMVAALGYWGVAAGSGTLAKVALGAGVPLLVVVIWGLFVAPRAALPVPGSVHVALQAVLFGLAALSLARAGHPGLAAAFAAAVIVNQVLIYAWQQ